MASRATFHSLSEPEQALVAETKKDELARLDEDQLADLLVRVRRARDKAVGINRREAAKRVEAKGARGAAAAPPRRAASKAEIFEDALARVSTALAKAARASAAALRAERLAAARGEQDSAPATPRASRAPAAGASRPATTSRPRRPVEEKTVAAQRASGRRKQAASDAR